MTHRRYRLDYPAYMEQCDLNYVRLMQIFPQLMDEDECRVPLAGYQQEDMLLQLAVTERCPYTTTLTARLGMRDNCWHELVPLPELTVRMYHDARTAEVVACQGADRFLQGCYAYPNAQMRQPDEKAQINRFLGECLSLCFGKPGYASQSVAATAAAPGSAK